MAFGNPQALNARGQRFAAIPFAVPQPSIDELVKMANGRCDGLMSVCEILRPSSSDRQRCVVHDRWITELAAGAGAGAPLYGSGTANQLLVTPGADIVNAIITNAGFIGTAGTPSEKFLANTRLYREQVLNRTMTTLRTEIMVVALEEVPGPLYVLNEDLSQRLELALRSLELQIFDKSSTSVSLAPTPLYTYATGVELPKHLWQFAFDEEFHVELRVPEDGLGLPICNPDHNTKVYAEIRLESVFEDVINAPCKLEEDLLGKAKLVLDFDGMKAQKASASPAPAAGGGNYPGGGFLNF